MQNRPALDVIREKIFEQFYLSPLDGKPKQNLYTGDVERVVHGVMHVSRASVWVDTILCMLREIGNEDVMNLSEEDILCLHIVALLHDAARKGENKDIWEAESAEKCQQFLESCGFPRAYAMYFASLITSKELGFGDPRTRILRAILQSADSLDIIHTKKEFDLERMRIWDIFKAANQEAKVIQLAVNALKVIAAQQDLMFDTKIMLKDVCLSKHRATLNPKYLDQDLKQDKKEEDEDPSTWPAVEYHSHIDKKPLYEHAPDCMQQIATDINNNQFLGEYYQTSSLFNKVLSFAETSEQRERREIRARAGRREITSDFAIKSLSQGRYYLDFLDGILPGNIRHPLRRASKRKYVVDGEGVHDRAEKQPLYTAAQKRGFSKAQAVSVGTPAHHTAVFNFGLSQQRVTGMAFFNMRNVLLTNTLSTHDFGSEARLMEFDDIMSAELFKIRQEKDNSLFSKAEFSEFKRAIENPEHAKKAMPNECLVRLRWSPDDSCCLFINTDTLETRLLAQAQARILKQRLLRMNLCDNSFEVTICYYSPRDPAVHLKIYDREEQAMDIRLANEIAASPELRMIKHLSANFEYLLQLPAREVNAIFANDVCEHQSVLSLMASFNDYHLIDYLVELGILDRHAYVTMIEQKFNHIDSLTRIILADPNFLSKNNANFVPPEGFLISVQLLHAMLMNAMTQNRQDIFNAILTGLNQRPYLSVIVFEHQPTIVCMLRDAIKQRRNPAYLRGLLAMQYMRVNAVDEEGKTALHHAVQSGFLEAVTILLEAGHAVNPCDKLGFTPLHYASLGRNSAITALLLRQPGIDINIVENRKHLTPLMLAINAGNPLCLKEYLDRFPELAAQINPQGQTLLHVAASHLSLPVLRYFTENDKRVDLNAQDLNGETALHTVIKLLSDVGADSNPEALGELACMLMALGAKLFIRDKEGLTPMDLAVKLGHREIGGKMLVQCIRVINSQLAKCTANTDIGVNVSRLKAIESMRNNMPKTIEKLQEMSVDAIFSISQTVDAICQLDHIVAGFQNTCRTLSSSASAQLEQEISCAYEMVLSNREEAVPTFKTKAEDIMQKERLSNRVGLFAGSETRAVSDGQDASLMQRLLSRFVS